MGISGRVPSFGPPKTPASVRVIPLPTVVVEALAAHLATFPTEGLVFTHEAGDMIRRSNFGTMWQRVTKSVGARIRSSQVFLADSLRTEALP